MSPKWLVGNLPMKSFHSPPKDAAYLFYRLVRPIIDPIECISGIVGYGRFIKDIYRYKKKDPKAKIRLRDLYPMLNEKTPLTPFDAHYFFQGIWLLNKIMKNTPARHVDVASTYELSGYISLLTKAEFVDLRPIDTKIKNLRIVRADMLHLPYKDNSLQSLSSLHVVEHIGLGRYGDTVYPGGTIAACKELGRVTKPGGYIYLSLPVGKSRICFNAHRILNPVDVVDFFDKCRLLDFSIVTDEGKFLEHQNPSHFVDQAYACGMYMFQKIRTNK
jgi:hypothetical protein